LKNHEKIIESLEKLGATVDRSTFSDNMRNPDFVERVRTSLEGAGATVPDSSTFFKKYAVPESPSPSPYALEMRNKAKSDYEAEVRNLKNQANIENYGALFPRATKSETIPQMLGGAILDATSLPGRTVAAGIGGLFTGLGEKILGNGEFLNPALDEAAQIMSRKGGNEYQGFIPQMAESIVKDPFLIPTIATGGIAGGVSKLPKLIKMAEPLIAKSPKLISTAGHGLAAGLENIIGGIAERGVDPTAKTFDKSEMITEGVLGSILGSAGHAGAEWLRGLGDTDIGRALIKKITPTKLIGKEGQLIGKLIKEGFDADVVKPNKELDAKKLGKFLSEQSSQPKAFLPDSKYTRIPEWIETNRGQVGADIGGYRKLLSGEKVKVTPENIGDFPEDFQIQAMRIQKRNPDAAIHYQENEPKLTDLQALIDEAKRKVSVGESGRENIISESEIRNFIMNDIKDLLPSIRENFNPETLRFDKDVAADTKLDPTQLQQLQEFLYNAGKESSPKYHPSKEEFAKELRKLISNTQSDLFKKHISPEAALLPKQYAALTHLEELGKKSPILNPDRPSVFEGGIIKGVGRGAMGLASQIAESRPIRRTTKEGIQAAVRAPERTQNAPEEHARFYQSLSSADQRVFMRAVEALRFDPNDKEALAILNSLKPKK